MFVILLKVPEFEPMFVILLKVSDRPQPLGCSYEVRGGSQEVPEQFREQRDHLGDTSSHSAAEGLSHIFYQH